MSKESPEKNPKRKIQRVCVYCAASNLISEHYFKATETVALDLVKEQVEVVYGGGAVGLMGHLADVVLREKGKIIGIMPQFMKDIEMEHKGVEDYHFVEDMHARKKKFLEVSDALVALPGGSGTLEELLEAITLKRLGLYLSPIVILNLGGYYDPLKEMLERCVEEKFMKAAHLDMWTFVDKPEDVVPAVYDAPDWEKTSFRFA